MRVNCISVLSDGIVNLELLSTEISIIGSTEVLENVLFGVQLPENDLHGRLFSEVFSKLFLAVIMEVFPKY